MRSLVALLAILAMAGCGPAPDSRGQARERAQAPAVAPSPQGDSLDSTIQFLLTSAASDFHAHRSPHPAGFRHVRLGHLVTSSGEQQYLLCGEFLSAPEGGEAAWGPFATIRTSGYEQWLGPQALAFCQNPAVTWHEAGDLSSALASRLESLR